MGWSKRLGMLLATRWWYYLLVGCVALVNQGLMPLVLSSCTGSSFQ